MKSKLRILIIGASGGTGQHALRIAVERGHHVTTLLRRPIPNSPPSVRQIVGDPMDMADLAPLLFEQDVVVSCLGQRNAAMPHLLADAAQTVIDSAPAHLRYVVVSQGLLFPTMNPLVFAVRAVLRRITADSASMEEHVCKSGLNWTIIRPPRLSNGPSHEAYVAALDRMPRGRSAMSRATLARFLIDVCENSGYTQKVVGLTALPRRQPMPKDILFDQ